MLLTAEMQEEEGDVKERHDDYDAKQSVSESEIPVGSQAFRLVVKTEEALMLLSRQRVYSHTVALRRPV